MTHDESLSMSVFCMDVALVRMVVIGEVKNKAV